MFLGSYLAARAMKMTGIDVAFVHEANIVDIRNPLFWGILYLCGGGRQQETKGGGSFGEGARGIQSGE